MRALIEMVFRKASLRAFALAILPLITSSPLYAQGVFDMGSLTSTLSIDHVTQSESAKASGISSNSLSQVAMEQIAHPVARNHNPSETSFTFSQKNRQENLARMVKKTASNDPNGAKEMARIFASGDIIAQIGQGIAPYGLRTNNVADAYTVYWMTAWQASNQDNSDFDRASVAAVRQQSANILMSSAAFVNADDKTKQELAEIYLVQAALIQAVADEARSNPELRADLAQAVQRGARASGINLSNIRLTAQGFVPRSGGRSDASEAADDDSQLAANDDGAQADGANMGDYALYAVAGTGLLAGMFALGKGFSKKG